MQERLGESIFKCRVQEGGGIFELRESAPAYWFDFEGKIEIC